MVSKIRISRNDSKYVSATEKALPHLTFNLGLPIFVCKIKQLYMKHCSKCGAEVLDDAVVCPKCGCELAATPVHDHETSEKDWLVTLLLCFFLGGIGVHRFYVGRIGSGIAMILTLGGLGIWVLIDLIIVACGNFKDGEGKVIKR